MRPPRWPIIALAMGSMARRWDVFCRVVDHHGDAGVCWRLARILHDDHARQVRLWIDDLHALARLEPRVRTDCAAQRIDDVEVVALRARSAPGTLPDVVVEGFGCGLPEPYIDAIEASPSPPRWINLEYLSAEAWVDEVHGL